MDTTTFDLKDFTPYLLAMAAEASSEAFQSAYKETYGMLRTEWRVLFHIGRTGPMNAKAICKNARLHKTKVSRAVAALEQKRFLTRQLVEHDRRFEELSLTKTGQNVFDELYKSAQKFDRKLAAQFTHEENHVLRKCLTQIASLGLENKSGYL